MEQYDEFAIWKLDVLEFWPLIQKHVPDRDHRIAFTAGLLKLLVRDDMDPMDVEDMDAEVRSALIMAGIGVAESDQYDDDS